MKFARSSLGLALGAMLVLAPLGLSIACMKGKSPAETTAQWTLTVSATTGGTISPSGTLALDAGSTQTFVVTPAAGYAVDKVQVSTKDKIGVYTATGPLGEPKPLDLKIDGGYTIVASFVKIWTLSAAIESGSADFGTLTPSGELKLKAGTSTTFTITPKATGGALGMGYYISSLKLDGVDVTADVKNNAYTVPEIDADHSLVAAFAEVTTPPTPPVINGLSCDYAFLAGSDTPTITADVTYDPTGPAPVYTWTADHGTLAGGVSATYTPEASYTGIAKITLVAATGPESSATKTLSLPVTASNTYSGIFGEWVDQVRIAVESDGTVYAASRNGASAKAGSHSWGGGLGFSTLAPGASAFSANTGISGDDGIAWLGLATRGTDAYCIYKNEDQGGKAYVTKNGVALPVGASVDWVNTPCIAVAQSPTNAASNLVYALSEGGPNWPPDTSLMVYDEGATTPVWTAAAPVKVITGAATDAIAMAVDTNGVPYIAYALAGGKVQVVRLKADKSGYEVVGTDLSKGAIYDTGETDGQNQGGMRYSLNIAFDGANTPYVCFLDGGATPAFMARCLKLDSATSTWVGVGNPNGSVSWSPQGGGAYAKAHYAAMAVQADGTVCIAFKDKADGSGDRLTAMMTAPFGSAGGWARMGQKYLSPSWVNWTGMALGADQKAWFIFKDGGAGDGGSVVGLDASSVVTVP